ncbi:hypothetical protein BCV64_01335 [Cylindrospermopsis raciborskii MVCC14]|nr:hypothetical protein BCV64_01335 [Cylindrospermopsis raciborskii MVCC14]
MLGRKEKTIVLTGVNRARAFTMLYINGIHNINILQITFNLKAPLFKGVGGDPMLLNTPTEKTLFSPGKN